MSNHAALTRNDEVKFVLTDRAGYDFARAFVEEHTLGDGGEHIVQPGLQQVSQPAAGYGQATLESTDVSGMDDGG